MTSMKRPIDAAAGPPPRSALRRWAPLGILILVAGAAIAAGLPRHLSPDSLIAHRAALTAYVAANLPLAFVATMLVYTAVVALSVPGGLALTILSGFLFGPVLGTICAVASATIGATILFLVAGSSVGDALRAKAGPRLNRIAEGFRADAFSYLLFLRLVPVAPFWLVNLAPALVGIPVRTFFFATLIGILPGTAVFATIGAGLDSVIAAQEQAQAACLAAGTCTLHINPKALVTREIIAGLIGLGLMALVPIVVKRWRARRGGGA